MDENKFVIAIEVTKEGSQYKATGSMTAGLVKMMIGELELIKLRLLSDLERSQDNQEPTQRFEFP